MEIEDTPLKTQILDLLLDTDPKTRDNSRREATGLLVKHLIKIYHFKSIRQDEKMEIWGYTKGVYLPHGKSLIKEFLKFFLGNGYNLKFCNHITEHIFASTMINPKDFFSINYPYLLPVENGILDLKKAKLLEFTPDLIFFSKLPIKYNPNAECPNIIKHLKDVLKDTDDLNLFQETLGNCLIKEYKYQKAVMMKGKGRNGKGVTLDLINRLLGAENCSSINLQHLEESQYAESNLFGKLANTSGDLNSSALKNTGKFKQLTGGDLITGDRKFLPPIYFLNYAKFFFACNELPQIHDMSDGIWERWILFDFPYKFVKKDVYNSASKEEKQNLKLADNDIKDKLFSKEELEGFLLFAYNGFKRLNTQGFFSTSKTMEETKNYWLASSNSCLAFCNELLEKNVTSQILANDLSEVYYNYCEKTQSNIKSIRELNKAIFSSMGIKPSLVRLGEDRVYVYKGITFKTNCEEVETILVK